MRRIYGGFPCGSTLGFTPPGRGDSGTFYEPGNFPPKGTATASNIAGSITSPVGGATYTWTYNSIRRTVTVVSADAKPTATGEAGEDAADSDSQNQSQDEVKLRAKMKQGATVTRRMRRTAPRL
ncbi:hypothetical protein DL771_001389 [Monosporascus sp. 5C6A]|nr:hypothetical protein DL771_001389 [Monosporascus sp. 5C6A]